MTVQYGFYNSVSGDRKYDAVDFARMFDAVLDEGIISGFGNEFRVTANGTQNLILGTGRSWFKQTWTYNDAEVSITADAADAANPRIDAIILEMDSSESVRANRIFYQRGTAGTSPQRPTLVSTATVKQYALYYVARTANNNAIVAANLTKMIGTAATPYAASRLLNPSTDPSVMHRNVFRGKYLGTAVTAAQSAAIANQTFEDLYIGDYWRINSVNYRIADINYYINSGNPNNTKPHLVVVSDTNVTSCQWNAGNVTDSGYVTTAIDKEVTNNVGPLVKTAFGSSHVYPIKTIYVNGVTSDGSPSNVGWYTATAHVASGLMMFGQTYYKTTQTDGATQLALFRLAPEYIRAAAGPGSWLRDLVKTGKAAYVGTPFQSVQNEGNVTAILGVRAVACII